MALARHARARLPRWAVWRRRLLVAVAAVAGVVIVAGMAAAAFVASTPGVGDAPARVHRILAAHHGRYGPPALPQRLADAVVAVEDEHFYDNVFVNVIDGAARAAVAAVHTDRDPGGSTIAQQLAKQLYGHGAGLGATLREITLGVKLSLAYSKPQVLDMYLNAVYFGHGYWGDEAAAEGYFDTSPGRLSWAQASLLAGLPQSPSAYDPLESLALARARQRHVLDQLVANRYLTREQADAAYRAPLRLRSGRPGRSGGRG